MNLVSTDVIPCVSPSDRVSGIYDAPAQAADRGQFTPVSEAVLLREEGLYQAEGHFLLSLSLNNLHKAIHSLL